MATEGTGAIGSSDRPIDPILASLVNAQLVQDAGTDSLSRPILALYSCYLPDPKVSDYDDLLHALLMRTNALADSDYVLVVFSSGSRHRPSVMWTLKAYQHLQRKFRKNLKRLYIVHPSPWFKLIMQVMGPVISPKFRSKVEWVHNLKELERFISLSNFKVPRVIQEFKLIRREFHTNLQHIHRNQRPIQVPANAATGGGIISSIASWAISITGLNSVLPPTNTAVQFGVSLEQLMGPSGEKGLPRVVEDCIGFILIHGLETEGLFRISPSLQSVNALRDKYNLNEPNLNMEDYGGVHTACGLLKTFFRELPTPVFEASIILGYNHNIATPFRQNRTPTHPPRPHIQLSSAPFSISYIQSTCQAPKHSCILGIWRLSGRPISCEVRIPMVDLGMCAIGSGGGGIGTLAMEAVVLEKVVGVVGVGVIFCRILLLVFLEMGMLKTDLADLPVLGERGSKSEEGGDGRFSFDQDQPDDIASPEYAPPVTVERRDESVRGRWRTDPGAHRESKSHDVLARPRRSEGAVPVVAGTADNSGAPIPVARSRSRNSGNRGGGNRHTIVAAEESAIAIFGIGLSHTALGNAASQQSGDDALFRNPNAKGSDR
ncbi:divergent CRAL/TRIO domain-containing protein [Obelidium mucronatum]|nr:divergent CRAL/TRIO domain-containing protein [Obelidium mucronatum]